MKSSTTPKNNAPEEIRLNRYISLCGVCSRRKADELISNGHVKINDKVITDMGYRVKHPDIVCVDNKIIHFEEKTYIVLNKPKDAVTTTKDPEGRKTVIDLISFKNNIRVFPVGRLDRNTTGVLILTNDGDLSYKLTHPSRNISKVYLATLDKPLKSEDVKSFLSGVKIDDELIQIDDISYQSNKEKHKVFISIHSGQYHVVKRIFESINYKVKNLDRITFAGIGKTNLKRGEWRFLTKQEVDKLYKLS